MKNIKISVIVPIYNVELYLRRCLDSLVNQTLKCIEIICINDCSPDNSLKILEEYAKKDERINIINFEKNQGVSAARNAGIKIAQGEYIGIVDSDDYVDLNYYEKLYQKAKETDADMVHANLKQKDPQHIKEYIYSLEMYDNPANILHCFSIYRSAFLRKYSLEYPIGIKQAEDEFFLIKALFFANRIEFVNDVYYHYIIRENSASQYIIKQNYESHGMKLVFDFINEIITDKEKYIYFFVHFLVFFIRGIIRDYAKATQEWKLAFAQNIVEIYKSRKYPVVLKNIPKSINAELLENLEKLYNEFENISKQFSQYPKIKINNLSNKKIYIWGAGLNGIDALSQCDNNNWHVEAFLDSNKELKEFNDYSVKSPQQILNRLERDFFLIISSRIYADEIAKICEQAGLKENVDFWRPSICEPR